VTGKAARAPNEPPFLGRFVIPASIGLGAFIVLFRTYYASWYIDNRALHWLLTDVVGALYGLYVMFSALLLYPLLLRRGARPAERVLGAFLPTLAWCAKEVLRMSEFFSFGESLFFLLFPIHFNIILIALGLMGICEIGGRVIQRRRGDVEIRVLTLPPLLAISAMVLMVILTNFDGGVSYFFLYNDLYQYLFLS
jgi:hypothetical protein